MFGMLEFQMWFHIEKGCNGGMFSRISFKIHKNWQIKLEIHKKFHLKKKKIMVKTVLCVLLD